MKGETSSAVVPATDKAARASDAEDAVKAGAWLCRSCACIFRVPYRYPPSPWAYCARCRGTLTPDEQIVALARLQIEGLAPPLLSGREPEQAHAADKGKPLLTVSEVAAFLNTTEAAIYAMGARKKLPGLTKVGRRVLFRRDALLRWLAEGEPRR